MTVFFPLEVDLDSSKNIIHTVKCDSLDPNKIGIKLTTVNSEQESEFGFGRVRDKNEGFFFFCYSKNEYTKGDAGVPHNFIVVCMHFCFVAWSVFESGVCGGPSPGLAERSLEPRKRGRLRVTGLIQVGSASWTLC